MNGEPIVGDRLSIPLVKSLERVRRDSRFFRSDNLNAVSALLLIGLVACLQAYGYYRQELSYWGAAFFLIFFALTAYGTWRRASCARRLVALYDGAGVPELVLDSQGITCPAVLLNFILCNRLLKSGQTSIRILWQDVSRFWYRAGVDNRRKVRSSAYIIRTKVPDAASKLKGIAVERDDFSEDEQKKITDFAQRFLSVPIEKIEE